MLPSAILKEWTILRGLDTLLRGGWCHLGPWSHNLDDVLLYWLFLFPVPKHHQPNKLPTLSPSQALLLGKRSVIIRYTHSTPWREWSRHSKSVFFPVNSLSQPLLKEILGDY